MTSYFLFFLLFLLQFVYFPIGVSHFEVPKVYAAEIIIFLLILIHIFRTGKFFIQEYSKPAILSISSIILLSCIHLLFFSTEATMFGNAFRLQGVFLLWILIALAIISSKIVLPKMRPYILLGILFLQFMFVLVIEGTNGRGVGTLGEPNALAVAMAATWPFLSLTNKKEREIKIAGLLIAFLVILVSGSRSGMVAFVVQLLFLLLTMRFRLSFTKATVIAFAVIIITYTLPFIEQKGFYEKRSEVWQAAVVAGFENPLLGHGFGNIEYALREAAKQTKNNLGTSYVDSSHNIFLDWWVQGGVVGMSALVILLFLTLQRFILGKQTMHMVIFLGLITALSFNPASIVSLIALWWLIGQGMKTA